MIWIKENIIKVSISIYVLLVASLVYLKPDYFYVNNNSNSKKLKIFGTGSRKNKSIFPLWFALIILAIIVYSLTCLVVSYC